MTNLYLLWNHEYLFQYSSIYRVLSNRQAKAVFSNWFWNATIVFTLRLSLKRCECASSLSAIADISRLSLSLNCSSENSGPADKSNSMTPLVEHSVAQPTTNTLWVSGARRYTKNSYRDLTPDLRQKWWWKYMPLKLFSNPTSPFRVTS